MSKLQVHRDVQLVCCGDPRQLRAPQDSWKGVPASVTLEGSQMLASLCPTHVHLTTARRFDPPLQEFCDRVAKREESVVDLVAAARQLFRCAGPWDTTLCLTHALRQTINIRTNRREFREQAPEESVELQGRDGPMIIWRDQRLIGAGWNPKVPNGAFVRVVGVGHETIVLEDASLSHAEAKKCLRLAHAITIDASQSKTLPGKVRVLESGHQHMTHERLLVAASRATSSELLAIH